MLSVPTRMAPACSSRLISVASCVAGARSRLIFEPARVARPLTSNRFLTPKGTPASGPRGSLASRAASMAAAFLRAGLASTVVKALRPGLCRAIRSSVTSRTSRARCPFLMAAAIAQALDQSMRASGPKHRCGLGVVRQLGLRHLRAVKQDDSQVLTHSRQPGGLDLEIERLRGRADKIVERVARRIAGGAPGGGLSSRPLPW